MQHPTMYFILLLVLSTPASSSDVWTTPDSTTAHPDVPTPPMGWNSWNKFHCDGLTEDLVKEVADALVSTGLKDAGYIYVNLDDCWQIDRNASGHLVPDPERFPSGMRSLADYIHTKGLLFGLYIDQGVLTCQRRPGTYGHEKLDAVTFASWGVDYVKNDDCYNVPPPDPENLYKLFWEGIQESGRDILHSVKSTLPIDDAPAFSNMRRVGSDIIDEWNVMLQLLDNVVEQEISRASRPGFWNDFDMLEIGNGGMTSDEYVTHMVIWCAFKAPLLLGNDVREMRDDSETLRLLTHEGLLGILRDPLGKSVQFVGSESATPLGDTQNEVVTHKCGHGDVTTEWTYSEQEGMVIHVSSNKCLTVRSDNILTTAECSDDDKDNQRWVYNRASKQMHLKSNMDKCLTVSNYNHGSARLRGCQERQSIFDWQGPNLWWMGYADAVVLLPGSKENRVLLKVDNKNLMCAGVGSPEEINTFAGPLSAGRYVTMLLNRDTIPHNVTIHWKNIDGLTPGTRVEAQDVYLGENVGEYDEVLTLEVKPHHARLVKLTPIS